MLLATARMFLRVNILVITGLCLIPLFLFVETARKPNTAHAEPDLLAVDVGSWRPLQQGVEYRKVTIERTDPKYFFDLKLIRFDKHLITPRVLRSSQYQLKGADVRTLAQRSGAVAALNANYFDEKGQALGFLKTSTQEVNRTVSQSALLTGIFGVRYFSAFIVHRDQFHPAEADEAVQAGPLLLNQGKALQLTRGAGRYSRRAVIGLDSAQRVIIGITAVVFGGLSLTELQEIFSAAQWGLQVPDLLNLDGGGSAQLYVKSSDWQEFVSGTAEVPVAIGFFPRGQN